MGEEKHPGGRPLKTQVDPAVAAAICENIGMGMSNSLAAEAAGVPRRTMYDWLKAFPEFSAQVTCARAMGAKNLTILSLGGGKGSANANWHLERRYREDYGPPKAQDTPTELKIIIEGGLPRAKQE